jgi:hypothetical protein
LTLPRQRSCVALIGLLVAVATGCTENDEQLFEEVGVTRLVVIDTGIGPQLVEPDRDRRQITEWEADAARLEIADSLVDLFFGEPCSFADTAATRALADGACSSGVVIESSEVEQEVGLVISITSLRVSRAEPVILAEDLDYDVDGVRDRDDNCPLVWNPGQEDDSGEGVGNACQVVDVFGSALLDSDGDQVPDFSDNCVSFPNPDQADTQGPGGGSVPDGIGDACREQAAQVRLASGATSFELRYGPAQLLQPEGDFTYLTVDLAGALNCDWESGLCTLDPEQVAFCSNASASAALAGC